MTPKRKRSASSDQSRGSCVTRVRLTDWNGRGSIESIRSPIDCVALAERTLVPSRKLAAIAPLSTRAPVISSLPVPARIVLHLFLLLFYATCASFFLSSFPGASFNFAEIEDRAVCNSELIFFQT